VSAELFNYWKGNLEELIKTLVALLATTPLNLAAITQAQNAMIVDHNHITPFAAVK